MDFDSLITVAATNSSHAKAEAQVKRYTTDVKPAKKPPKSTVQSDAVKAFLRKKEIEEQKKKVEAMKERERLLELRSAAKHNRRASNMARRTKDNDFGINFHRLQQEKEEKELADAVAAAVGANSEEVIVSEKKRRRRKKLLSDERLEHDLGADKVLALRAEYHGRNGDSYSDQRRNDSLGSKYGRDSVSVPHRPVNTSSSSTPEPSRGLKRPAPPPPDFFSLLKIAKTKQFEPIEIPVKKKVEAEEDRPMTREERERYRTEKEYLAEKHARSLQKQAAPRSDSSRSDNSQRPPSAGGTSFKIPKTKTVTKTDTQPPRPPPSRDANTNHKTEPRSHSSSKKTPPIQNNIANQLNAKVTKFPSSFNNVSNGKLPSESDRRKSHQPVVPDRRSAPNGLSRTEPPKPTKPSSGPPDTGRHSANKSNAHSKGPTSSAKPSNAASKSDPSERIQSSKVSSKPAAPRPSSGAGDGASVKTTPRNPFSTQARSKNAVRVAPISNPRPNLPSRPPPTGARPDASSRLSDQKAARKDVPLRPKMPLKPASLPAASVNRKEAPSKSQMRPEIRKAPQGQDSRRPASAQEARKAAPAPEVRKTVPVPDGRKPPPTQKVGAAQEVRRVPPGQEVRRVPPAQDVRRVASSQDVRRVPPGKELRRAPTAQDLRRAPLEAERRRLPPSQEIRRLPSGQVVRRTLPPEMNRPYPPARLPPITRNPGSLKRRIESSDEEDEDMDDFIDDGPMGEDLDYSRHIRDIFGYDKRRFVDEPDDDEVMETSYAQQMKEEARSTRAGLLEDLEDIRKEQEMKAKKKKKS